jgi:prepilin-type N-terminal cleavage/methylation domain-containing protein
MTKGFTLLEVLLVMVLLSLGAMISFLPISAGLQKRQIELNRDQLINTIQLAQNQSITAKDGLAYGIHVQEGAYVLIKKQEGAPVTIKTFSLPKGIFLLTDINEFVFSLRKGRLDNPVVIKMEGSKYWMEIKIDNSGQVNYTEIFTK